MPAECDQSSLVIPNDAGYAPLVGRFAADIAGHFNFKISDADAVAAAVELAVRSLLDYSFEPNESGFIRIEFDRIAEGLRIRLHDRGLPFGIDGDPGQPGSEPAGFPLARLREYLDEVYLNNRGQDGKEVTLIKHIASKSIKDYFDACLLTPFEDLPLEDEGKIAAGGCRVRQLQPDESAEVSKIIYKTYGYNYPTDYVYYPEKIAAMNVSGRIHSAVAVAPDNRLVGHCTLQFLPSTPRIAELSQGAVVPGYRGKGCFTNLTAYLVAIARQRGLAGIFSRAVTHHTHSQQTALQFGFKDCGVMLGLIPAETVSRGFRKTIAERGSMMLQYLNLALRTPRKIYLPTRHHQITARIYAALGHQPELIGSEPVGPGIHAGRSLYDVELHPGLSFAAISLNRYGRGALADLRAELKKLRLQKTEILHLKLPLSHPHTASIVPALEALGFFFSGILPGALPDSDALILQYLNNVPVDYEKIKVVSPLGRELVAYVRQSNP